MALDRLSYLMLGPALPVFLQWARPGNDWIPKSANISSIFKSPKYDTKLQTRTIPAALPRSSSKPVKT
jgi:hypothetical protein